MLAAALAARPRLLLLDEPSAGAAADRGGRPAGDPRVDPGERRLAPPRRARPAASSAHVADRVVVMADGKAVPGVEVAAVLRAAVACAATGRAPCRLRRRGESSQGSKPRELVIAVDAPFSRDAYLGTTIENGVRLASRNALLSVDGDDYRLRVVTLRQRALAEPGGRRHPPCGRPARGRRSSATGRGSTPPGRSPTARTSRSASSSTATTGPRRPGEAAERVPDRPDQPRDRLPFRRIPDPEEAEDRVPHRRHRLRARGAGCARPRVLREPETRSPPGSRCRRAATDLAPQILQARRSGATALLVWGQPAAIAEAVVAARSSGWNVPVYAPPSAEDPLRPPGAGRPPGVARRADVRFGPDDRGGGAGAVRGFQSAYEQLFGAQRGRRPQRRTARRWCSRPTTRCTPTTSRNVLVAAIQAAKSTDPREGAGGAEPGLDRGGERRLARLQPHQPRGRGRRRRLLRPLRRHDLTSR